METIKISRLIKIDQKMLPEMICLLSKYKSTVGGKRVLGGGVLGGNCLLAASLLGYTIDANQDA